MEEVFVRLAPVVRLTVSGRELRPTGEHPFYVPGRGWVLAWSLRRGDVIQTLSGEPVLVEDMVDTGEVVRVYNFRVRELQTYFVGGDDWGFAVWSHNTNGHEAGSPAPQGGATPRPDLPALSGGRSGSQVKNLTGPPNSLIKGSKGRVYVTDDKGQVILDITKDRVKPVTPGQGFGPKRPPTPEELDFIDKLFGGS